MSPESPDKQSPETFPVSSGTEKIKEQEERARKKFVAETKMLFDQINADLPIRDARLDQSMETARRQIASGVGAADKLRMHWETAVHSPGFYRSHPYDAQQLLRSVELLPDFLFKEQRKPIQMPGEPLDSVHATISNDLKAYIHPEKEYVRGRDPFIHSMTLSLLNFYNRPVEDVLQEIIKAVDKRLLDIDTRLSTIQGLLSRNQTTQIELKSEQDRLTTEKGTLIPQRGRIVAARMAFKNPQSFVMFRVLGYLSQFDHLIDCAETDMMIWISRQEAKLSQLGDDFLRTQYAALHAFDVQKSLGARMDIEEQNLRKKLADLSFSVSGIELIDDKQVEELYQRVLIDLGVRRVVLGIRSRAIAARSFEALEEKAKANPHFFRDLWPSVLREYQEAVDEKMPEIEKDFENALHLSCECERLDKQRDTLQAQFIILKLRAARAKLAALPTATANERLRLDTKNEIRILLDETLTVISIHLLRKNPTLVEEMKKGFSQLGNEHKKNFTDIEREILTHGLALDAPSSLEFFKRAVQNLQKIPNFDLHVRLESDPISQVEKDRPEFSLAQVQAKTFVQGIQNQLGGRRLSEISITSQEKVRINKDVEQEKSVPFHLFLDCVREVLQKYASTQNLIDRNSVLNLTQTRIFLVEILEKETGFKEALDAAIRAETKEEHPLQGEHNAGYVFISSSKNGIIQESVRLPNGVIQNVSRNFERSIYDVLLGFHCLPAMQKYGASLVDLHNGIQSFGPVLKAVTQSNTRTKRQCEHLQVCAQILYGKYERSGIVKGGHVVDELRSLAEWIQKQEGAGVRLPDDIKEFGRIIAMLEKGAQDRLFEQLVLGAQGITESTLGEKLEQVIPFFITVAGGVLGAQAFVARGGWLRHTLRRGFLGSGLARFAGTSAGRRVITGTLSSVGLGTGSYVGAEAYKIFMTQGLGRRGMESDFGRFLKDEIAFTEYLSGAAWTIGLSAVTSATIGWLGRRTGSYLRSVLAKPMTSQRWVSYQSIRNFAYRRILRLSEKMNAFEEKAKKLLPGARRKVEQGIRDEIVQESGEQVLQNHADDLVGPMVSALISNDYGIVSQAIGNALAVVWAMGGKGHGRRAGIVTSWHRAVASLDKMKIYQWKSTYLTSQSAGLERELHELLRINGVKLQNRAQRETRPDGEYMVTYDETGKNKVIEKQVADGVYKVTFDIKGKKKVIERQGDTYIVREAETVRRNIHEFRPSKVPTLIRELYDASLDKDGTSGLTKYGFDMNHETGEFWVQRAQVRGIEQYLRNQGIAVGYKKDRTGRLTTDLILVHVPTGQHVTVAMKPPADDTSGLLWAYPQWGFP